MENTLLIRFLGGQWMLIFTILLSIGIMGIEILQKLNILKIMTKKRILTGDRPSGLLHLGDYVDH